MKRLVLLCVVALSLPACKWAFQRIVETVRHVSRWSNGNVKKEGDLADGEQAGRWTFYYESGRKRSEGPYAKDVQTGAWTSWYENGNVEWTGEYDAAGGRAGLWIYHHDNGQRRAVGPFRGDREQGYWQFFDRDGRVTQTGEFDDGRLTGFWTMFHPDGRRQAEGLHLDGVRVGPWRVWPAGGGESAALYPLPAGVELVVEVWPGGTLRRVGLLRGGRPTGAWITFHEDGKPRLRANLQAGDDRRFWAMFAADGTLRADGLLAGSDVDAWRCWSDGKAQPQDRVPLPQRPPMVGDGWSAATLATEQPPADALAAWLAELRAPAAAVALPAPAQPLATPEQVAAVPTSPRVVAKKQAAWTVREDRELKSYVQQYGEGKVAGPSAADRYAVPKARQGQPRRREDLEGKAFPLDEFKITDGSTVKVSELLASKRVLVVVLRGFFGQVCVYCIAQTKALADRCDAFAQLGVEVLVVYPGSRGDEAAFLDAYKSTFSDTAPPYRVAYDEDLSLVKQLGIEGGDLAYPTTIFIDRDRIVRYAYTGQTRADRPAAEQVIAFIKGLKP